MNPSWRTELVNWFFILFVRQTSRADIALSPLRETSRRAAPEPYPVETNTRFGARISGCDALTSYCVVHGNSQRTSPLSGVIPARRDAVKTRICLTPASVTSIGEEYDALSS